MSDAIHPTEVISETPVRERTEFKSPSLIDLVATGNPNLTEGNVDLKAMLDAIEVSYLEAALKTSKGVVSHAAVKLGLRRTTFIEKMKKYQIVRQGTE